MKDDLDLLRQALDDRAIDLVTHALGKPPNRRLSKSTAIRWGSRGSFALCIRGRGRALWYDFEAEEGGDLLHLIRNKILFDASFDDTISWARNWAHITDGGIAHSEPTNYARGQKSLAEDARALIREDADGLQRKQKAETIWRRADPVDGTAAEIYISTIRKIPITLWPDCLRYDPIEKTLILQATTATGEFVGIQRIYLTPDGGNVKDPKSGRNKKLSLGPIGGAAVRLPGRVEGPLLLAEGPETGLSVWCATGYETLISLGSMSKLAPPLDRHIVICRDDDPWIPRGGSERAISTAKRQLLISTEN